MDKPDLIKGDLFCDVRGHLLCWNSYNPTERGIKRSYVVENRDKGSGRGFHGHLIEQKYIRVISGAAKFICVPVEDAKKGDFCRQSTYILDFRIPSILHIPGGFYHAFKILEENTIIIVDSTSTLEESKADDLRLNYLHFGELIWQNKNY